MGRKDILTKQYLSNPKRFADVFNAFLFDGEQKINAADLKDFDTASAYILPADDDGSTQNRLTGQKYRDIFKQVVIKEDDIATYVLLGIENQSSIHYAMPARNMLYNALAYDRQINETIKRHKDDRLFPEFHKDDRISPVITLTIYWGDKEWDGPRKRSDMLTDHPAELDNYIDNIQMNLFSIIDDDTYEKCSTDLKDIFKALHFRNNKEEFQNIMQSDTFQKLDKEDADILSEFSKIRITRNSPKGGYDMCKAIEEMMLESRNEGLKSGQEMMVFTMFLNHDISEDVAIKNLNVPKSVFEEKLQQFMAASAT